MNKLTEILGVVLKSEKVDEPLYNTIRNIQFLLNYTYKSHCDLKIIEIPVDKTFTYRLVNEKLRIHGYVRRDSETGKIIFLIKDSAREKWCLLEGFPISIETYNTIGVIGSCELNDLILFLGGQKGWAIKKYVKF